MPCARWSGPFRTRHSHNSELSDAAQEVVQPGGPEDHMLHILPGTLGAPGGPRELQEAAGRPGQAPGVRRRFPGGSQEAPGSPLLERVKLIHIRCRFVDFSCSCGPLPHFGGPRRPHVRYPPLGAPRGFRKPQVGSRRPQEAQEETPGGPQEAPGGSRRPLQLGALRRRARGGPARFA